MVSCNPRITTRVRALPRCWWRTARGASFGSARLMRIWSAARSFSGLHFLSLPLIKVEKQRSLPRVHNGVQLSRGAVHHAARGDLGDFTFNRDLARAFCNHHELLFRML